MRSFISLLVAAVMLVAACSSADDTAAEASVDTTADSAAEEVAATAVPTTAVPTTAALEPTAVEASAETDAEDASTTEAASAETDAGTTTTADAVVETFTIDVWADNWMAVYVDGVLIGEDSVPITTERSFNSETFTFEAALPFTMAIEAKDYRETDSGLEYIGASNQQMGDGGIIAQIKNSSGEVVAVTTGSWQSLVVHRAPLNTDCADDSDPNTTCEYEISETPANWTAVDFDDSGWTTATVWQSADVDPKIGYDDISWDSSAQFIWGTDLLVDNTVLLRTVVTG